MAGWDSDRRRQRLQNKRKDKRHGVKNHHDDHYDDQSIEDYKYVNIEEAEASDMELDFQPQL